MTKTTTEIKPKTKVAKKASKPASKPAKKSAKKVKARNVQVRSRVLSDKQKLLLSFIHKVKGVFSLKKAGEAIGHKNNQFAPMYAHSTLKSLINRGLVKKTSISERKSTYSLV